MTAYPEVFIKTGLIGPCSCGHAYEVALGETPPSTRMFTVVCFRCRDTYKTASSIQEAVANAVGGLRN